MAAQAQAVAAPAVAAAPSVASVLQRACACGGHAGVSGQCAACAADEQLGVQRKLTLSRPGDHFEREADRIADAVVSGEPSAPATPITPLVQCQEDEEEETVQAARATRAVPDQTESFDREKPPAFQRFGHFVRAASGAKCPSAPQPAARASAKERAAAAVGSGGRPLDASLRGYFEPRLGRDLSSVRLHDGPAANEAAAAIGASAYTLRNHIAFAPGAYTPQSIAGRRLLAHELVHTIQQARGEPRTLARKVVSSERSRAGDMEARRLKILKPLLRRFVERVADGEVRPGTASEGRRRRWARRASRALALIEAGEIEGVDPETIERLHDLTITIRGKEPIVIEADAEEAEPDAPEAEGKSPEEIAELRAQHPGEPPWGRECDPEADPYRGDALRQAVNTALRMAQAAIHQLDNMPSSGDPMFHEVFGTFGRLSDIDPAGLKNVRQRYQVIASELSKIRVSWGSNPMPDKDEVPEFQKFVCYASDPFPCRFSDAGEPRTYHAYTGTKGDDVHICGAFWKLSEESQARAALHEMAHHAPDLGKDFAYGEDIWELPPQTRLENPDNYVEFAHRSLHGAMVSGNPDRTVEDCKEKKEAELPQVTETARRLIDDATPRVRLHHIECWFGSRERAPEVMQAFANVREILNILPVHWTCVPPTHNRCKKSMAFVAHDERGRTVNLCPTFFARHRGPEAKGWVLIHELVHVQGANRPDEKYARKDLRHLACFDPTQAAENSENYVEVLQDARKFSESCPPCEPAEGGAAAEESDEEAGRDVY